MSYLYNVNSCALEEIVANWCSTRPFQFPFLIRHFLGIDRQLRVGASTFPLGKRTWIDDDDAVDYLNIDQSSATRLLRERLTLINGANALVVINMSGFDINHSPSFK